MYLTRYFNHYSALNGTEEYITPCATIRYSNKIGGRGVFSTVEYNKGDIIEIAPAILQEIRWNKGMLNNYVFGLDEHYVMIGFGYTSMYNHSKKPNAQFDTVDNNKIKITALKKILPNEEIYVSYGHQWFTERNFTII